MRSLGFSRVRFPPGRLRFGPGAAAALFAVLLSWGPAWAEDGAEPPAAGGSTGDAAAAAEAFDRGEIARDEERWKEAADLYWRAIERDRGHWLAHVRYQEASAASGADAQGLLEDYDSFVKDFPGERAMKLHRIRLDPPAQRVGALQALLKEASKDPDVLVEVGRVELLNREPERAAKSLAAAHAVAPERTEVLLLLAEAEFKAGKRKEARARLEQATAARRELFPALLLLAGFDLLEGRNEEAAKRAEDVLGMRPWWIAAFLAKAEALDRMGQRDKAIAALEGARAQKLEVPALLVALGDLHSRDATEAGLKAGAELYERVLKQEAKHPRALYGLAWVLERQGKFDEAEKRYRESALGLPTDPAPVHSVGYCLFKMGRIADAQVQMKKAIDLDPTFVAAYANLGATYDAQANYAEAIKWYEKILRLKGQENNIRAIVNLAFDHEQVGAFPKAEEYLRKARKLDPEDPNIAVWLGDNLYFQEKWKDAERSYSEAVGLDPKCFFGWRGLGFAQGKQKRWNEAAQSLEKAKSIKPDDLDVLASLGYIYLNELSGSIEDLKAALKNYEEYVAAGGPDPAIPGLIEEIRKEIEASR